MKIILLCSAQPNQIALANKIAETFELEGIVVEDKIRSKKKTYTFKNILDKISDKVFFRKISNAWSGTMKNYSNKYSGFPDVAILRVSNINEDNVRDFIVGNNPELVMVSGTSILKKNILQVSIPKGIINLHTGLSPYIKGGPNCTNWCLATNQFHLIGNTVMWIDSGIDSGDLFSTAIVKFTGNETLLEIHIKVMEEAHKLYLEVVRNISLNKISSVKQSDIGTGTIYYNRDWGFKTKSRLLHNLKYFNKVINAEEYLEKVAATTIIKIS